MENVTSARPDAGRPTRTDPLDGLTEDGERGRGGVGDRVKGLLDVFVVVVVIAEKEGHLWVGGDLLERHLALFHKTLTSVTLHSIDPHSFIHQQQKRYVRMDVRKKRQKRIVL